MSATPCSIYDYETVKSAFAVNDLAVLQHCWANLWKNIDAISESSLEQLLDANDEQHELQFESKYWRRNLYSKECARSKGQVLYCNKVNLM
jgi:hypothetical protein